MAHKRRKKPTAGVVKLTQIPQRTPRQGAAGTTLREKQATALAALRLHPSPVRSSHYTRARMLLDS